MATRRPTMVTGPEPQGRPRLALAGIILALGGLLLAGIIAQGGLGLPVLGDLLHTTAQSGAVTATSGAGNLTPHGAKPAGFAAYRDPQGRFALYASASWQAQGEQASIGGKATATTIFAPTGQKRPLWRIAPLSAALDADQAAADVKEVLGAEGGTNMTTTSGPSAVKAGGATWQRTDLTMDLNGTLIHVVAWYRATPSGSALVIAEALNLNFATTDTQDFTPMLASLNVGD